MAKVKLTKNELKKQKDDLNRFTRYLPTLELKKKQLLLEISKIQHHIEQIEREIQELDERVARWADVFAEDVEMDSLIEVEEIKTGTRNIAGSDIPVFEDVFYKDIPVDFFNTPLWIDAGMDVVKSQIKNRAQLEITRKQKQVIQKELRITIQRIKLFEEVKIPEARENIRTIKIALADQQTAEVVRGKIAKSKIQKKKMESPLI